ncbi:hypothetical protein WH47_07263 [Habropoda laboriosa]|uniref:Uncharacterized protein n=1 Tax=Habropoda laboriosa TaxID=597456 RepID=A0A0L7R5V1_9HYME|nr:hypothetical protein WH47_07263 [Habropoda laboriosa]
MHDYFFTPSNLWSLFLTLENGELIWKFVDSTPSQDERRYYSKYEVMKRL